MRYTTEQYNNIADNMVTFGGSFMHHIGKALQRADRENTEKLEKAFPEEFERHLNFFK